MNLNSDLSALLDSQRILTGPLERYAFASDASFYHLVPQAVVRPANLPEVGKLFAYSRQQRIPLVFRAAGTSLSGQAITDGILVNLARDWGRIQVEADGALIRVQPGVIGARANGIPTIGAGWGFGAPGELQDAGAAAIVTAPAETPAALAALVPA